MKNEEILFEKFEIISCLKQDEYSSVYLARHIYLGKNIILKALCTKRIPDTVLIDRFKREARILARLDHPNIIKVLDFGTYDEYFYISFEYFESNNLRQLLGKQELLLPQRRKIFVDLLEAVRYAHSEGIIHRDIKPENILVNEALELKLSDFGLAQMHTDSLVTDKLGLVGTPSYMSPEQIQGETLTTQSDLFSCGIVAYELFLNSHPFLGRDINESLNAIASFDEEKLAERLQPLPEDLRNVIGRLLKKKVNQRWENASAVLDALGVSVQTDFAGKPERQSLQFFRPLRIAVIIGVVLIGALAILFIRSINSEEFALLPPAKDTPSTEIQKPDTIRIMSPNQNSLHANSSSKENVGTKRMEIQNKTNALPHSNDTSENVYPVALAAIRFGELSVACLPWALISIDSMDVDTTPLKSNLRLPVGTHKLKLSHPQFPVFRSEINILAGEITTVKVNLDTLFGFLAFNVYPWGEISIDGKYIDRTPIKPLRLIPGAYQVRIKNTESGMVEKQVIIKRHDTLWIQHRFGS